MISWPHKSSICPLLIGLSWLLAASSLPAADPVPYLTQVKPLLKKHCFACHGTLKQNSSLRLDAGHLILKGGESGPAVVPGKPADSPLLQRILETDADLKMPQQGIFLKPVEIELIKTWIEQGASFPANDLPEKSASEHWAFNTPRRVSLPESRFAGWGKHPIDRLAGDRLFSANLVPSGQATPAKLLRRLYIDLIGLPPGREQLLAFLADPSDKHYRQIVDQLLESPQYGQRWGRHWMDVWRYSDWYGRRAVGDVRNSYPHIWRWRDWIINSLNEGKGYDQMIREMIAADELHPAEDDRIVATGYLVRSWFSLNYDTWMRDVVEHTGKAFLGLRFNCALCHDHKYDPISQEEYFRFRAFFEPLELRHDRVPGGPALPKYIRYQPGSGSSLKPISAGMARIYDHTLEAQTHMYRLGDQRSRFENRPPVTPGMPRSLGGKPIKIAPVTLPDVAYHPGLKPFVAQQESARTEKALAAADKKLESLAKVDQSALEQLEARIQATRTQLSRREAELKKQQPQPGKPVADLAASLCHWNFETLDNPAATSISDLSKQYNLQWTRVSAAKLGKKLDPQVAQDNQIKQALRQPEGNLTALDLNQANQPVYLQGMIAPLKDSPGFTVTAVIQQRQTSKNHRQVIVGSERQWILLLRGINEQASELRCLLYDQEGNQHTLGSGSADEPLLLNVKQAYGVSAQLGKDELLLTVTHLGSERQLQSKRFSLEKQIPTWQRLQHPAVQRFVIGDVDGTARFQGLIDEITVWKKMLPVETIAGHFQATAPDPKIQQLSAQLASQQLELARLRRPLQLAELEKQMAQDERAAIDARLAADRLQFQDAPAPVPLQQAIAKASAAERKFALGTAEHQLASLQLQLAEATASTRVTDTKGQAAIQKLQTQLASAIKLVDKNRQLVKNPAGKPGYTSFGPTYPRTSTGRRSALAHWLTDRSNPLTARVAINHIWMRHFGRPFVESTFDFGRGGKLPSHPELLDWLAVEFMDHDWDMKHIHRLVVTSRLYQMTTLITPATRHNLEIDADNRYCWRMDNRRVEAEVVRDSILALGGNLDLALGGPEIAPDQAMEVPRRSLYFGTYPEDGGRINILGLFNAADPNGCYRRDSSVMPQQSLALVNSQFAIEQSRRATRHIGQTLKPDVDDESFVTAAYEVVLSRRPTMKEQTLCLKFLERQRTLYSRQAATPAAKPAKTSIGPATDPRWRARESLVRTLFSHHDFITIH
ncbi:MAG: DUF1553 domain-containing protein [Pirellulaceae bacterium]